MWSERNGELAVGVCGSQGTGVLSECGVPLAVSLERALSTQARLPQFVAQHMPFQARVGSG